MTPDTMVGRSRLGLLPGKVHVLWSVILALVRAFGALGGDWVAALSVLGAAAAGAFLFAWAAGRWIFVPENDYRPAVDV